MTLPLRRVVSIASLSCTSAFATAAAADGAAAASSPAQAGATRPAHVHIEDAACWPAYPAELRAVGLVGRSVIRLSVDASGVVRHLHIESPSGPTPHHRVLDTAAAAALAACPVDAARDAQGRPTAGDAIVSWTWNRPGAAADGGPVPVSGTAASGMSAVPIMSKECRPEYPAAAVRARATGQTRLRIDVDAGGHAVGSTVLQSAGASDPHQLLDAAIRDAMTRCPFQPALDEGGTPLAGSYELTYAWRID